ncbi:type II toxin-antitoxin system HicB family antitoxin [Candidatus Kaiserbacteria bacterium]|nr:type II toxin-antitoxin system HicB family antitoxin [Candidatus Kaiserbacteria bacterium]
MKRKSKTVTTYTAVVEKDEKSGYWAYVPALPGCYTQGETLDAIYKNLQEATVLYLAALKDDKKPVPHSHFLSTVQVQVPV